jgi:hypothetical protein
MPILSDPLGRLEHFRADVAEWAVHSDSLVPHLDPFKDCCARLVVRAEALVVNELVLQGRPEAFHHEVVVTVAGTAHALRYPMLLEKFLTLTGTRLQSHPL